MTRAASLQRVFIAGGAGFIGSSFVERLLGTPAIQRVTVYDNFTSGREWHLDESRSDPRLTVVRGDVKDAEALTDAMAGHDTVIHLASNPDIARAATDPTIDFIEGTLLTNNVVEAVRKTGAGRILYASGSGVYGDLGDLEAAENHGPLIPISTYGASKLAGESLISSYCYMFDISGCAFRFGNVVGRRQTHGVGFDFVRRLLADGSKLHILGDGSQSKSYIDVDDVVSAVLTAAEAVPSGFAAFNVATGDYITVAEIADMAVDVVGLHPRELRYEFSGGSRGWKGDVPVVRINTAKIRSLGWENRRTSAEALWQSMSAMVPLARAGAI